MKNREEYEASIYAKRDALLAKRKKNIRMTVSALSIVLCFCAAALTMPKMISKTPDEQSTSSETAAASAENDIAEEKIEAEGTAEHEEYVQFSTKVQTYQKPDAHSEEIHDDSAEEEIGAENVGHTQFAYNPDDADLLYQRITNPAMPEAPHTTKKASSMGKYTNNEIIAAAYSCLTAEEQKAVEGVEPFVTATRTSDGEEYYDILYTTDRGKIKVTVNAENLELTVKKNTLNSDTAEGTTSKPPMTATLPQMTTPAYNPNE